MILYKAAVLLGLKGGIKEILEITTFIIKQELAREQALLWAPGGNHQMLVICYRLNVCVSQVHMWKS